MLRAYPKTLWEGASDREILNNQTVLGRALKLFVLCHYRKSG